MAWLTYPLQLHGSREFECGDLTTAECDYYKEKWHFWYAYAFSITSQWYYLTCITRYIADYVFALPTVAFFMSAIGIFIIGHVFSTYIIGHRHVQGPIFWRKLIALIRYSSYRRGHVSVLQWNTAPVGVLMLGLAGAVFFFCQSRIPQTSIYTDTILRHGPGATTFLLVGREIWRVSTTCNKIRLASSWVHAFCIVSTNCYRANSVTLTSYSATATKTNWITLVTGVSHEKLQVFHRWIAYAFFVLALLHTFPFIVYHIHWHDMEDHFSSSLLFYWTGIVAIIFQAWLTFMSHSTIRSVILVPALLLCC
jgi:hypothetical protein